MFLEAHQNLIHYDQALMRTSCVSNSCSNEALSSFNSAESYLLSLLSETLSSPPSCSETLPATKSSNLLLLQLHVSARCRSSSLKINFSLRSEFQTAFKIIVSKVFHFDHLLAGWRSQGKWVKGKTRKIK